MTNKSRQSSGSAATPVSVGMTSNPSLQPSNAEIAAKVQALNSAGAGAMGSKISVSSGLLSMLDGDANIMANPSQNTGDNFGWETHDGQRWSTGAGDGNAVDANDVDQGALGDCYFHAAMAAVARANPQAIKDLITDNNDGTYDVTLHVDADGDWVPWAVEHVETVTNSFASDQAGTPVYAGNSGTADNGELWVMLIEKAYAQALGGYDQIVGGSPGAAMEVLGQEGHTNTFCSAKSATELGVLISAALENKNPVTCYTPDFANESTERQDAATKAGISGSHAYAPISVDIQAGTIKLQNPWASGYEVTMSLDAFKLIFDAVQVGG